MMNVNLTKSTVSIALLTIMTLAVATLAVAPAAAQTTTNTTEPVNTTVQVDNETRSIYVQAINATGNLSASIEANGTEVASHTLDARNNGTDSWEWSLPANQSDQYRVIVSGADAETVDVDLIEQVEAGGGLLPQTPNVSPVEILAGVALLGLLALFGITGRE